MQLRPKRKRRRKFCPSHHARGYLFLLLFVTAIAAVFLLTHMISQEAVPTLPSPNEAVEASVSVTSDTSAPQQLPRAYHGRNFSEQVWNKQVPALIGIGSVHTASTSTFQALAALFHFNNSDTEIGLYGDVIATDTKRFPHSLHFVPNSIEASFTYQNLYKYRVAPHQLDSDSDSGIGDGGCLQIPYMRENKLCYDMMRLQRDRRNNNGEREWLPPTLLSSSAEEQAWLLHFRFPTREMMKHRNLRMSYLMARWRRATQKSKHDHQIDYYVAAAARQDDEENGLMITKTTAYYLSLHTAAIFAREFAARHGTRIVWTVRDPVRRIWSVGRHWRAYRTPTGLAPSGGLSRKTKRIANVNLVTCQRMRQGLCEEERIRNMTLVRSFRLLLSAMSNVYVHEGRQLTEDDLLFLWMQLYYSAAKSRFSPHNELLASLYYVPLVYWSRQFLSAVEDEERERREFLSSHFRVVQYEWLAHDFDRGINAIRCFAMTGRHYDGGSCAPYEYRTGASGIRSVSSHSWHDEMTWQTQKVLMSIFAFPNALIDQKLFREPYLYLGTWQPWIVYYRNLTQGRNDDTLDALFRLIH